MGIAKKLLIIGFSCSEVADGYANFLIKKLMNSRNDVSIKRCALGGLAPPIIPSILRQILSEDLSYTHILLEISTSMYGRSESTTEVQARNVIRDIINTVISNGIEPMFLILYRRDKNIAPLDVNKVIKSECLKSNVLYLDLASNMEHVFGDEWFEKQYKDYVHTNESDGQIQAGVALPTVNYFLDVSPSRPQPLLECARKANTISIADIIPYQKIGIFQRKNYERSFVVLPEHGQLHVEFEEKTVFGLSFVMGPWSADFYVDLILKDQVKSIRVQAFDERSYYPRLGFRPFNN